MIRGFFIVSVVVCILSAVSFSQTDTTVKFKNNAVYGELLGNMGGLSLNYERKIYEHTHGFFTARVGLGAGGIDLAGCPLLINHIFFKGKNHFEMGFGVRLIVAHYSNHYSLYNLGLDTYHSVPTANFTYRYQKPDGRFIFRTGWTPLFYNLAHSSAHLGTFLNWLSIGVSAGYVF